MPTEEEKSAGVFDDLQTPPTAEETAGMERLQQAYNTLDENTQDNISPIAKQVEQSLGLDTTVPSEGEDANPSPETSDDGGFGGDLLSRASELGFSNEEAKAFGSPDLLASTLSKMDRSSADLIRQMQQPMGRDDNSSSPETSPTEAKEMKPFEHGLSEDTFDEGIVKAFDGLASYFQTEVKNLKDMIGAQNATVQQVQGQDAISQYERFVSDLGKGWEPVFGSTPVSQLAPNSASMQKHQEMSDMVEVLSIKNPNMDFQTLCKRALHSLHYDHIKSMDQQKLSAKVSNRGRGTVGRPSSRKSSEVGGEAAAMSRLEQIHKEMSSQNSESVGSFDNLFKE